MHDKKPLVELYRHRYDEPRYPDGTDKPNQYLGCFELVRGETDGRVFDAIGIKDGHLYRLTGCEIDRSTGDPLSGTICFADPLRWLEALTQKHERYAGLKARIEELEWVSTVNAFPELQHRLERLQAELRVEEEGQVARLDGLFMG